MPPGPERVGELLGRHAVNIGFGLALAMLTGIAGLQTLAANGLDEAAKLLRLSQRSRLIIPDDVRARIGVAKSVMDQIRELASDMRNDEEALLRIRSEESRRSDSPSAGDVPWRQGMGRGRRQRGRYLLFFTSRERQR